MNYVKKINLHWFCTQNHILEPFSVRHACTKSYVTSEPYPRASQIWCQNVRETWKKKVMKEECEILSGIDAPLKKQQGGAIMAPPPPPGKLGLTKDININKWSGRGLICMDFHVYCHRDLWFHQCSLISMAWSGLGIRRTTPVPAPPPGTASSCCWWALWFAADQLRTKDITPCKRTCSLLTLHDHWC